MEQLSNFTTLRVGGPARKIVHAHSEAELIEFVKAADKNKEQVLILGGGSNLLISDAGFAGTVIRVESKGSALDYDACSGGMIEVAAGEDWDKFVCLTIDKGFADLESLSGIPGTVGGAPRVWPFLRGHEPGGEGPQHHPLFLGRCRQHGIRMPNGPGRISDGGRRTGGEPAPGWGPASGPTRGVPPFACPR